MASKKIKLAETKDLPEGKQIVVETDDGTEIALFNLDGEICALENTCPHMEGPLGEGAVKDGIVTCPWHGWQFDVKTAACKNMPGREAEKIPLSIEDGTIYWVTN